MRVFVLAAMLLASSSLCSIAQEQGKTPTAEPQAGPPAQADQNSQPQRDQKADRDQPKTDDREMGPDWRMRRGDRDQMHREDRDADRGGMMHRGDRMGREEREMGQGGMMRDYSERMGRDRDRDRGRYREREEWDRDGADRYRGYRGYDDADRPRRRVKICVEYDNGEEYCRYRQ